MRRWIQSFVHSLCCGGVNLESLFTAKAIVAKVGSVEAAEEALKTLMKLQ